MRYARYTLILAFWTLASAAACGAERETPMLDVLISIIPKSDEVVAAVIKGTQPVTLDGEDFVRVGADVVEVFKSGAQRPNNIAVDLKEQGDETPNTIQGETYLFFLRSGSQGKEAGRRFLTNLSRPVRVPADKKDAYFALMRDYVALAHAEPAKRDLKGHVLKVLHCGIPFFHEDAAKTANLASDWTPAELEKIKEILAPQGRTIPAKGIERHNLVALVLIQGTATQALAQSRMEFKQGNVDGVYYGLNMRKAADVDRIFTSFFDDADPAIRTGGLKVAGLLKKRELLDQFEQNNGKQMDEQTRAALAEARKLLSRD